MNKSRCLRTAVALLMCFVIGLSCTACGSVEMVTCGFDAELSEGYSRKATEEGQVTENFKNAMADFSINLLKNTLTKESDNDLVSPLSAMLCLAMVANGADGDTLSQMEAVLGLDIDTLNKSLYAYRTGLYSSKKCKLNIADSIWFDIDYSVSEDFLQTNADWYDNDIFGAPFDNTTLQHMNSWAKENTDDMIDKVVDGFGANSVIYLINALTFDAEWQEKYETKKIEENEEFENYDKTISYVTMLGSTEDIYMEDESAKGFAKNYAGGKYSFVGILPNEDIDIYDYVEGLTGEKWMNLWNNRRDVGDVSVEIPEFTYSSDIDLNETLKSLGMVDAFSESDADFSKINSDQDMWISKVEQKTIIEVDRNGTKASAITFSIGTINSSPLHFVFLYRPFVYAIVDNETGLPLFIGVVTHL